MTKVKATDVAIIIPLFVREELTEAEKISMRHLDTHLSGYDKYFVAAEQLNLDKIKRDDYFIQRFPEKYFGSAKAHNNLLTSTFFYNTFSKYKFILMYHFDSLVFSDQLLYWCEQDYDCIAPPWMASDYRWLEESTVGNGGFSLRKVSSFIKLYSSSEYWKEPEEMAQKFCEKFKLPKSLFMPLGKQVFKLGYFNNQKRHLNYYLDLELSAEDRFISMFATQYYPGFKLASAEAAIKFAFERYPGKYYEQNNHQLPFGCHAYERFDLAFWEPYLLKPENEGVQV